MLRIGGENWKIKLGGWASLFEKGKSMIKGEIVRTLRPIYLYCSKKKGKVNKPL